MVQDFEVQLLVELGLNALEAKVYLTLLEIGQASLEEVSSQTGLSQQDVANALFGLQKIGLVK